MKCEVMFVITVSDVEVACAGLQAVLVAMMVEMGEVESFWVTFAEEVSDV